MVKNRQEPWSTIINNHGQSSSKTTVHGWQADGRVLVLVLVLVQLLVLVLALVLVLLLLLMQLIKQHYGVIFESTLWTWTPTEVSQH
jgi:hypothetical protein